MTRSLYEIATEIERNWTNVDRGAKPYLDAMKKIRTMRDSVGADSATTVIRNFLVNASGWSGDVARRIKTELKFMDADKEEEWPNERFS